MVMTIMLLGPIWYNMNYLILGSLFNYGQVDGPYQKVAADIYSQLRNNLVENAFNVDIIIMICFLHI